jgi:hypothetical protein
MKACKRETSGSAKQRKMKWIELPEERFLCLRETSYELESPMTNEKSVTEKCWRRMIA